MLAPRSVGRPGPRIAVLVVVERLKVTREADASVLTAQDGARVADVCTVDNRAPTLAFEVEEDGDGNGATATRFDFIRSLIARYARDIAVVTSDGGSARTRLHEMSTTARSRQPASSAAAPSSASPASKFAPRSKWRSFRSAAKAPGSIVVIWLLMSSSTSSDGGNTPACITLSELPAMFSFSR